MTYEDSGFNQYFQRENLFSPAPVSDSGTISSYDLSTLLQGGDVTGDMLENGTVTGLQIADATIGDAKISELSADKIQTGVLSAVATLGDESNGFVKIDGPNKRIIVNDGRTNTILIGNP